MGHMEDLPKDYLFAYQPILDRQHRTVALALLHRHSVSDYAACNEDSVATARVVVNAGMSPELVELLGDRKVFINVDAYFLMSGMASMLPATKVVLELVHYNQLTEEMKALCRAFKHMGYSFALDDYVPSDTPSALLDDVDIVKLDIRAMSREKLAEVVGTLRGRPISLLAEKVESQEDFDYCHGLGFDLFQGYYFARPTALKGRRTDARQANILNILAHLDHDAGDKEIGEALKQSPDLTLHLLRLVTSVAFGSRSQIGSMREALSLFGRDKLRNWLQMLLFMSGEMGGMEWALFELAAKRGHMIESLVRDVTHQMGSQRQDRGYMVGMLSLVDVLLDTPLRKVLPQIGVVEEIQQAILEKSGVLGTLLTLCEALETADFDAVIEAAGKYHIPLVRVMEVQREATLWATAIAADSADLV
jgi:c-di-GMP-related signal transduction protein